MRLRRFRIRIQHHFDLELPQHLIVLFKFLAVGQIDVLEQPALQ
jgi:hypothetical protein